jgi:probable HAF family extracellular repeat protein
MSILQSLCGRSRKAPSGRRAASWRPALEPLETRYLLSYSIVDLGTFGGQVSHGYGINSQGQVGGDAEGLDGIKKNHPFLYSSGVLNQIPTPGYDYGVARGINESAQVVGFMYTLTGDQIHRAFAYQNGVTTDLGTLGGKGSQAYGNNDLGMVTGLAEIPDGTGHAFLWVRNQMIDLGTLGGESFGYDVNNKVQVVGYYRDATGGKRGFLWQKGYMYDLGDLGGAESDAWGINEKGQVAGYADTADDKNHAYLWTPDGPNAPTGKMTDIGVLPGGSESFAYQINNYGDVVGASTIAGGSFHAILYSNRFSNDGSYQLLDLNSSTFLPPGSGWKFLNYSMAINDVGQITGYGFKDDNSLHAFLLSPGTGPSRLSRTNRAAQLRSAGTALTKPATESAGLAGAATGPKAAVAPASQLGVSVGAKQTVTQGQTAAAPAAPAAAADAVFASSLNAAQLFA